MKKNLVYFLITCLLLTGCSSSKSFKDGTYYATGKGWNLVEVTTTIKDGKIIDIETELGHQDVYSKDEVDNLINLAIMKNSSDIETGGLTETGFIEALSNCLGQATGEFNIIEKKDSEPIQSATPEPTPTPTPTQTPIPTPEPTLEPTPEPTPEPTQEPVVENNNGVRPEFKASMDAYYNFYKEYADFMNRYESSSDVTSMMTEYLSMMNKLTEQQQNFANLEQDLNEAELNYYAEIQNKVLQLLS